MSNMRAPAPYSPSGRHSQSPAGHRAQGKQPSAARAAVKQSGIVAVDDPCPPGFGSLKDSRGFYHQIAFALPFGLASTHAGVWQCRPAGALSGTLDLQRAIPRLGRHGGAFVSFLPAIGNDERKRIGRVIRRWRLHRWSGSTLTALAKAINAEVQGWW